MGNNESSKQRRKKKLRLRDGPGCFLCGLESDLTLHHIKKKSEGGSNDLANLVLLCEDCHIIWHQNEASDFMRWVEQMRAYLIKIVRDL